MYRVASVVCVALAGCGFRSPTPPAIDPDGALPLDDAATDSSTPPVLYATSTSTLYVVDLNARSVTMVGTIGTGMAVSVESITVADGALVAIPYQTTDALLRIDPATAAITGSIPLAGDRVWTGLTWKPPGSGAPAMLLAGTGSGSGIGELHEIQVGMGRTRSIGAFGSGMYVAGDIAWFPGHGLYGTMQGGSCNLTCIAKIDPVSGAASVLYPSAPYGLWALTAFDGQLRALAGDGMVYAVDPETGVTSPLFDLGTFDFWDTN